MLTMMLLAVLAVLLVIVLAAMFRTPKTPAIPAAATPQPQLARGVDTHAWDARKGDVVSIRSAAEDFSDLDFTVDRRSAYQTDQRRWLDLSGEFQGRRVYLEVYGRTSLEALGILDGRKLTLPDVSLTEQQLIDFDNRQDPNATITYEGKRWNFESSREMQYFEDERGESEGLYRWLFREQNGDRSLCIEKWEGEPFDVRVARRLKTEDITVYPAA